MNSSTTSIPSRLGEIIEDFRLAEGREKIDLLIEYAPRIDRVDIDRSAILVKIKAYEQTHTKNNWYYVSRKNEPLE